MIDARSSLPRIDMTPPNQPRRVMIFHHGATLRCFNGHTIDTPIIEHGVIPCQKRGTQKLDGRGRKEDAIPCGQYLYLLAGFSSLRDASGGGVLVTEVDETERGILDRSGLSPWQILKLLGLTL